MKTRTKSQVMIFNAGAALALLTGCSMFSPSWHAPEPAVPEPAPAVIPAPAPKPVSFKPEPALAAAAAKPSVPFEGEGWQPLFDGRTLAGWLETDFAGKGPTHTESGLVIIETGASLSGINYTNGGLPVMNYEVALDAMKLEGGDFFCGLTFPVGDSFCSLILGGWGGAVTGLSSIDDEDASENETTSFVKYDSNVWYRVRVRVTDKKIQAWLDDKQIVDLKTADHRIGLRFGEIEDSKPLGIASYETRAAIREIKIRKLAAGEK